jgi:hypothetical protein
MNANTSGPKLRLMYFLLTLTTAAALAGCRRGPEMVTVKGTVHFKDGTIPQGAVAVVQFNPADDSSAEIRKAASGPIEPDGSFEMMTRMPGDGVYLGKYKVTFTVLKTPEYSSSLIQPQYTRPSTTPYTITVEDDMEGVKYEIEPLPGVKGAPAAAAASGT